MPAPPKSFAPELDGAHLRNRILNKQPFLAMAQIAQAIGSSLARHPKRVFGGIGAVLLGTGVTAFGISPMMPDAADLPVTQVYEPLTLNALPELKLLPPVALNLYRSDTVRRDDSTQSLLTRLGVRDVQAQEELRNLDGMRLLFDGRSAGKLVSVEIDEHGQLLKMNARWLPDDERQFMRLKVERQGQSFASEISTEDLAVSSKVASGVIQSSLFAATDSANVPDSIAVQLAEIFSSEIDFRRDLRKGDRFNVVYESLEADGEPVRAGRVLSAEFINNGRAHEAVWFQEDGKKGAFYGFDGQSSRKDFLTSPLKFSRVSSGYGMRFHPILGREKAHLGVDYAAPTGTPVRTLGDGVVTFAGRRGGYGNVIEIAHRNNKSTLYAHLSRIDVKRGERVEQGEFIGAVGTTGRSTGPHLHLEFKDHGVHQDPLEVARNSESIPINPALRSQFDAVAQVQRQQLDAASSIQQASAQ